MGKRKFFGTDGIRGKANIFPMTGELAFNLGRAVTHYFHETKINDKQPLIIVGKDTRLSCYMLEQAFSAGVCAQGGQVILTGPLPTPGVSFATSSMRATAGVMISASHNPYTDNGIKIFNSKGHKLSDEKELEIEKMLTDPELIPIMDGENLGKARRLDEIFGRYIVHVKAALSESFVMDDMRVILDCANGASYKVAPMILEELGAEVMSYGVRPNGKNINFKCGSMFPEITGDNVTKYRADIGICLDGDADRVILSDENGDIVNGDQVIGILAKMGLMLNTINKKHEIVGTVMSNLGLENYIKSLGLSFFRSDVGDRYILDRMRRSGSLLGGEPSGHIIYRAHSSTGDGLLAALKVVEAMKFFKKPLSELASEVVLYPQILKNIVVSNKPPFEDIKPIMDSFHKLEKELGDKGRIVLRYSGTELLARVMVEAESQELTEKVCSELEGVVRESLA